MHFHHSHFVRYPNTITWQDVSQWQARALAEKDTLTALTAILALTRSAGERRPSPAATSTTGEAALLRAAILEKIADQLSYTRSEDQRNCLLIIKQFSRHESDRTPSFS